MVESISGIPTPVIVALVSAIPVSELRASIPLGIAVYGLPWWEVFMLAQIGNAIPILLIYSIGDHAMTWAESRQGIIKRITSHIKERTQKKFGESVGTAGLSALAIFVGIPLPGTGAWTGALGAFLLRIPIRKAFPAIVLGNIISATIVTLAVTGAVTIFKVFI